MVSQFSQSTCQNLGNEREMTEEGRGQDDKRRKRMGVSKNSNCVVSRKLEFNVERSKIKYRYMYDCFNISYESNKEND